MPGLAHLKNCTPIIWNELNMKKHEPRLTQFLKKTFISSTCIGPAVSSIPGVSIMLRVRSLTWQVVSSVMRRYSWNKIAFFCVESNEFWLHCHRTSHSTTPHPMDRARSGILLLYYSMIWVIVIAIFYYKWEGQEQINFS